MRKAVIEIGREHDIMHIDGYLVAEDCLIVIEKYVMWMYKVYVKDESGIFVSDQAGLWLGKLLREEDDEQVLILRVLNFMQNMSFFGFIRNHRDWSIDYDFCFVEAML
ncbi:hypothetical protein [Paenibacillus sp. NAIST15-1]|uniref:hypothetical protein n=1 Tax=Paenibacillus sp. NAIST15-1 TaxID=1605994 RepID=UPI00086B3B04|nr:hypothetical protein [Paenibacillus sp. NAIST15-1]GAV13711.1 hypothetical protein PBN151_3648 [Paenibacillus sp. NAIST15-1]